MVEVDQLTSTAPYGFELELSWRRENAPSGTKINAILYLHEV